MRPLHCLVVLGCLLVPHVAAAGPTRTNANELTVSHPWVALTDAEARDQRHVFAATAAGAHAKLDPFPSASALDCEHAVHDIQLDPSTGATVATLDLKVRARGRSLARVGFTFDEGLEPTRATAPGREALIEQTIFSPTRVTEIVLSPPLLPGESTVVHLEYSGTLACGSFPDGGGLVCTRNADFQFFGQQSVYPYVFDPVAPRSMALDALTREITLRVPESSDVIATGQHLEDTEVSGYRISRWTIDRPLARTLGLFVFTGKLGRLDVSGRTSPTSVVFPRPQLPIDARLTGWSSPVLDFVERSAGSKLPFDRSLTLVRLPADVGDPGTATFGMTLLSETYARAGEMMHEETWAHENVHLFWGIVVPEKNPAESRLMSEGLATLTQIDYTGMRHFRNEDRDTYLARRFLPIGIDLRTMGKDLPPVVFPSGGGALQTAGGAQYTVWAYTKSAATLDHLRVTVGEDVFAKALDEYRVQCSFVGCSPSDFRYVLEQASGKSMETFFERWVTASSRPAVSLGFEAVPGGAEIEVGKDDAMPMTLELWLRLEDGQLLRKRVDLVGRSTTLHVDTPAPVRAVAVNPRHELMVSSRSRIDGDLDFDGEVDGADLLRCSRLFGKTYKAPSGLGLWNVEETYDPRCDLNDDLRIDDADLDLLTKSFGKLKVAQ